jgi:hypothetical protein
MYHVSVGVPDEDDEQPAATDVPSRSAAAAVIAR